MTISDEASGCKPALEPDDEPSSIPVNAGDSVLDSKDSAIEPPTVPAYFPPRTEDVEATIDSSGHGLDTPSNSQAQAVPGTNDAGSPLNSYENSNTDLRLESPVEDAMAALDSQDDKMSQDISMPGSMKQRTDANDTPEGGGGAEPSPDQFREESMFISGEAGKGHVSNPFGNTFSENDDEDGKDYGIVNGGSDGGDYEGSRDNADTEEDFFSRLKTQTKPIYVPTEPDTRFEEGVPLLDENPADPAGATTKPESQIDQIFNDDEGEESGFFNEVQKSGTAQAKPSHLTRKSTSQVIGSVGGAQDSPKSETSPTSLQFNSLSVPSDSQEAKKTSPEEEDLAARWQEALVEDDDLFLEDEVEGDEETNPQPMPQSSTAPAMDSADLSRPFETPVSAFKPQTGPMSLARHQPSMPELRQGAPLQSGPQTNAVPVPSYFASQQQPSLFASRAESFAERSKEGYKSPYDIPLDLTRPRRHVGTQKPVVTQPGHAPVAPPRSSSIPSPPSTTLMPTGSHPPPAPAPAPVAPSRSSSIPSPPSTTLMPSGSRPPPAPAPASNNFYEELPMPPPKPRRASSGRYAPGANQSAPGITNNVPPPTQGPIQAYGEHQRQPERLGGYGSMPSQIQPSVQNAASRYSPRPPSLQAGIKPPPSPRYSPAPPPRNRYASQPQAASGQGGTLPFQPRTSSPLAYHEKSSHEYQAAEVQPRLGPPADSSPPDRLHPRHSVDRGSQAPRPPGDVTAAGNFRAGIRENELPMMNEQQASPPRNIYAPPAYVNEFSERLAPATNNPATFPAAYPPNPTRANDSQTAPPRRSQTQSPSGQQMRVPSFSMQSIESFQRPASAHDKGSPITDVSPYAPSQVSARNRSASQRLHFVRPNDEQQLDPLERWKGSPIIAFGLGGVVISCFPKHIPRYVAGQAAPMIKSSPGEVNISQLKDWMPIADSIVQHPGPLKAKSKKKDLLAWLSSKIAAFENEGLPEAAQLHHDSRKRQDERILLWKVIRIVVENDGALEGSENLQASLRNVVLPDFQTPQAAQAYAGGFTEGSTFEQSSAVSRPDAVNPQFMESLRNDLAMGDRERAVWGAVDSRLWGHAMVLASSLNKHVWKQVVQEFVRREVRSTTGNTESLAALYEIFAGNFDESIDELVPASVRAGLQMVSKGDGSGPTKNALDGLDRWRDTLGLILSNRSPEDYHALLALGRLLSSYGRTDAAHICYIFSRAPVFGGPDDPQASIVLLGADHQHFPSTFFHDEDAVLLTEAYEYAISVLAGAPTATLPHLLAFKLLYAKSLADRGRKSEALQYCDSIAAALRATTRPSGYHHQHLYAEVGELSARLRQATADGGGSWISKPSMEKVSGSMWARFNSFVSGDDSDAASAGSGKGGDADIGPFAKVSGTPTVSPSPSVSDFYGPYPGSGAQPIPANPPSRYHPTSQYAPTSSPEQFRGGSSFDSQRSIGAGFGPRRSSQEISPPTENGMHQGGQPYNSPAFGYQSTPPQSSHMPLAPVEEDMTSPTQAAPRYAPMQASVDGMSYQAPVEATNLFGGPLHCNDPTAAPQVDNNGYMPPTSRYDPSANETFTISTPESKQDSAGDVSHTKKSTVDDEDEGDDDIAARSAAILDEEKRRKDREADEAFRKAAEEDSKKPPPAKKSWLGGWFGGGKKKDDSLGGGPIRAKLGEENSFYYDKDLKKWVNKKDPDGGTPVRATPPPPKASAPPSRVASAASDPPMGPPPNAASSDGRPSTSAEARPMPTSGQSSLGEPPARPAPRSASSEAPVKTVSGTGDTPPPSRPKSSLGNASSIDDLIGAPQARKGNTVKGKKKGRYVDVMAK